MNGKDNEIRVERIKIQYEFSPKYIKNCKYQSQIEDECRGLHQELGPLRQNKENEERELSKGPNKSNSN